MRNFELIQNLMRKIVASIVSYHLFISFLTPNLFAGAWTLKQGKLWIKSSLFVQRTSERYASEMILCGDKKCRNGERTPYFFSGNVAYSATYLDIWYGLSDKIEIQFQVPYFDISFEDDVNPERPTTSDIGDLRFGARYRILSKPIVSTFKIAAKAPTGFFNKDSEVVPIGDGQWDLEIQGEFARSLWPMPFYVNFNIGYRFRLEPDVEKTNLDPGDEFTFRGEVGYNLRKNILFKAAIDGFWGQEFTSIFRDSKLKLSDSERNILYFEPGIYWMLIEPLAAEASIKFSLSGKNYPAGEIFGFGLSYSFSLH